MDERPTPRLGRLAALFSLGLVAVIGLAEATARMAQAAGPPVLRWYDATAQLKVVQMEDLGQADVVFAGTSMAWQGLVPEVFTAADPDGRSAYNAGLAGGVPVVTEPWLLDQVIPRLEPDLVIWGLSSLDLSVSYGADNLERYKDALETRSGWLASVERVSSRASALVGYRSILRDPESLFGAERSRVESDLAGSALILGAGGERRSFEFDVSDTRRDQVAARVRGFAIDGTDIAAIHRTIAALDDRGIELILVELPAPDRYVDLHPNDQADLNRVHATIVTIADLTDTRLIDLRHGYTDDDYVDYTHLDESGARALTAELAGRLIGTIQGIGEPPQPVLDAAQRRAVLETTARTVDTNDTVYHYLLDGEPRGGSSELWWRPAHYGHSRDLATGAAGDGFDVLMVGDSRMLNAGDPGLFTELSGRAAYNGGLPNAGPEVIDAWLRQQAVDLVGPGLVIYGIVPQQIRVSWELEGSCMADMSRWDEGLALRIGAFGPVEALQGEDFASLAFGNPPAIEPSTVSPIHRLYRSDFSILGQRDAFEQADEQTILDWAAELAELETRRFKWCEGRVDQYAETISWLTGQGIDVVSVILPIRPEYAIQWGPEEWDVTLEELRRIATEAGSTAVIDFNDLLALDQYRDQWHANPAGAEVFTRTLVRELAAHGL